MKHKALNIVIILGIGLLLFVAFEQAYTTNTAKIIVFGYFLTSLRLYELLEDIWMRILSPDTLAVN